MSDVIIAALRHCVASGSVHLRVLPRRDALNAWSWREIAVRGADSADSADDEIVVPVDDEYGDADQSNPTAWLHLVLASVVVSEEEPNVSAWLAAVGLPEHPETHALYRALCAAQIPLRTWVGADVRPVPESDIEFNTGLAKALRACALPPSTT